MASGNQDGRADRLAALQRLVRLARIGELEALADLDPDLPACDHGEERPRARLEVLPRHRVVVKGGPGQIDRAGLREAQRREGRNGAGGVAEADEEAAPRDAPECPFEGVLADRVVGHGYAFSPGELAHA